MSRIGKAPILLPTGCLVSLSDSKLDVSGKKGSLSYIIPQGVVVDVNESNIIVSVISYEYNNLRGLVRTLIYNMVTGVSQGYEKKLHIMGVGFNAKVAGKKLTLNLGFSHSIEREAIEGIEFLTEKDPKGNDIVVVQGIDKQLVGQVAASLRSLRKPEPYKGKGVRYLGEKVRQKAGKTAGK